MLGVDTLVKACHLLFATLFCFDNKYKLTPKPMQSYINDFDISNTVAHFTYMNPLFEYEKKKYSLPPSLSSGSHTLYNILLESG